MLYDNYLQAQILSQEVAVARAERGVRGPDAPARGGRELDRLVEFLPTSDEMAERRGRGVGLTRPEIALLVAYSKRSISVTSRRTSRRASTSSRTWLGTSRRRSSIGSGRCWPSIRSGGVIATIVSNDVVNSQGVTFVSRLVAETGATPAEVVRAFRIARDVVGAVPRWDAVSHSTARSTRRSRTT